MEPGGMPQDKAAEEDRKLAKASEKLQSKKEMPTQVLSLSFRIP